MFKCIICGLLLMVAVACMAGNFDVVVDTDPANIITVGQHGKYYIKENHFIGDHNGAMRELIITLNNERNLKSQQAEEIKKYNKMKSNWKTFLKISTYILAGVVGGTIAN